MSGKAWAGEPSGRRALSAVRMVKKVASTLRVKGILMGLGTVYMGICGRTLRLVRKSGDLPVKASPERSQRSQARV